MKYLQKKEYDTQENPQDVVQTLAEDTSLSMQL